MPVILRWVIEAPARHPGGMVSRVAGLLLGQGLAQVTDVPDASTRIYIAPTNYAGQGFQWARTIEKFGENTMARNMAIQLPGGFMFSADTNVSFFTFNSDATWAEAEYAAARQFTHVLVEAERSMFGKKFGFDLETEIAALQAEGISVALICHGTDIRNPANHSKLTAWSPYPDDPRTELLQENAIKNLDLIKRLGLPVFLSTPDLNLDVDWGTWCPVIIDVSSFENLPAAHVRNQPRLVHLSSDSIQKGSDRIEPALRHLIRQEKIDLKVIQGAPSSEVPELLGNADIMLDQFRLGSYGVAACEAMAAGRVVVGHVLPQVRELITAETGLSLPIVEATIDTLPKVISELIEDPVRFKSLAQAGPKYVGQLHSGKASADALLKHWINTSKKR